MQSDEPTSAASPAPSSTPRADRAAANVVGCSTVFLIAVPIVGLLSEVMTGLLSEMLPLFPAWWHLAAVMLAVFCNAALHVGTFEGERLLLIRALVTGFTLGMALLYGLAEAPAIPVMFLAAIFGLGVLAAAPYFVLMGMVRLLPKLWEDWHRSGRTPLQLASILLVLGALPITIEVVRGWERNAAMAKLAALADAMELPGRLEQEERLAADLRGRSLATQRSICVTGSRTIRQDSWLMADGNGSKMQHIANGRPFWFVARMATTTLLPEDARKAFHRAHGESFDEGEMPMAVADRLGSAALQWRQSAVTAWVEPEAALAKVDWELHVGSRLSSMSEARFDMRLPPGAVASSLSLWIDGVERPAAFAATSKVQKAFEAVVAKNRDPALLQEIGPDMLRLRLFPVSRRTPMHVRVGLTVPLLLRDGNALLQLPEIVGHNCGSGRVDTHQVRIHGVSDSEAAVRSFDDRQMRVAIPVPRVDRTVYSPDADGFVVQQLVARASNASAVDAKPRIVVVDASSSVARAVPDPAAFLSNWLSAVSTDPSQSCIVYLVIGKHVQRIECAVGEVGSHAWLAKPFVGGVDARAAIRDALSEAEELGQSRVYWLHGAMGEWQNAEWQAIPAGVELAALALHPGRNLVRESSWLRDHSVNVPRLGSSVAALHESLVDFERFHRVGEVSDCGDTKRIFSRAEAAPAGAHEVTDQLARLWAARQARSMLAAGDGVAAAQLAARYRLVTAGSGAVVLERAQQYQEHGLEPGALVGREPDAAIGSLPVAEPSTFFLFGSGLLLLFVMWWKRRRQDIKPAAGI